MPNELNGAFASEIEQSESAWYQAAIASDIEWYKSHLDKDFSFVMFSGEVLSREAFIDQHFKGERKLISIIPENTSIRIFDGCAVATGTVHIVASFKGVHFEGPTRMTRVWVSRDGKWRAAAFHASDARVISKWETTTPPGPLVSQKTNIGSHFEC